MTIFACIVTFNPFIDRLRSCILSIKDNVKKVLVFDNGSDNCNEIIEMINTISSTAIVFTNSEENIGLASALQLLLEKAKQKGADWILTLDQDSICPANLVDTLSKHCSNDVGIVAPLYYDERRNEKKPIAEEVAKQVDFCITSGSLTNINALEDIGGFDVDLFIDLIDNDLCYRLIKNNYRILEIHSVIINHELGVLFPSKASRFFLSLYKLFRFPCLRKLSYKRAINPLRIRYAVRNMIYLNKKHNDNSVKAWSKKTLKKTIISAILRSHFSKKIYKAIKQGKIEGREMASKFANN